MPRHPLPSLPYAIYHVYCLVAHGGFIFDDDSEAIDFIEATLTLTSNNDSIISMPGFLPAADDATHLSLAPFGILASQLTKIGTDPEEVRAGTAAGCVLQSTSV